MMPQEGITFLENAPIWLMPLEPLASGSHWVDIAIDQITLGRQRVGLSLLSLIVSSLTPMFFLQMEGLGSRRHSRDHLFDRDPDRLVCFWFMPF